MDSWSEQRGQVLAMVALFMVVLLAAVALTVDFGHVYAERRRMQNAADAGALAGARELCFGSGNVDPARSIAYSYATSGNGAQDAEISILEGVVTVTATETINTYLAGIVGLRSVFVPATAAAACGKATSVCGLWPVGFEYGDWQLRNCGEEFLLWEDGRADCTTWNCDVDCDGVEEDLALDERAWLDFTAVMADGQADPCDQTGCGNEELKDRIQGDDGGVLCRSWIDIPACTAGDSGVRNVTWQLAGAEAGEIKFIPLYDPSQSGCAMVPDPGAVCGNERYYIVDVGCIEVVEALHLCPADECRGVDPCPASGPRVIRVRVSCDPLQCATDCGTTGGGLPGPGDIRAVSLIR